MPRTKDPNPMTERCHDHAKEETEVCDGNATSVKCLNCNRVVLSCGFCSYWFDRETAKRHRKRPESYMKIHLKNRHQKSDTQCQAKRQRVDAANDGANHDDEILLSDSSGEFVDHGDGANDCFDEPSVDSSGSASEDDDFNVVEPDDMQFLSWQEQHELNSSVIQEQQEEDARADDFVQNMMNLIGSTGSLSESDTWEECEDSSTEEEEVHHPEETNNDLSLDDFAFLDLRSEEEKLYGRGKKKKRISQVQRFFFDSHRQKSIIGGFSGLIQRASNCNREAACGYAPPNECEHIFLMYVLMTQIKASSRPYVTEFQRSCRNLFGHDREKIRDIETHIPDDAKQARAMLFEGVNSVHKNLPTAGEVFIRYNHAMVDLKGTLLVMAGLGTRFNFVQDGTKINRDGLNGTQAADYLRVQATKHMEADKSLSDEQIRGAKIGWFYFWSDSFLRCFVKQKDNSVWVLTVTVCPPEDQKSNGANTRVLAIGKSSDNHTPVIDYYIREAWKIRSGFPCYLGAEKKICHVTFWMITWNADRPERQVLSGTRKEGVYGMFTGWAMSLNGCVEKFVACEKCYERTLLKIFGRTENLQNDGTCNQCFDWTLKSQCPSQQAALPPKDYPASSEDPEDDEGAPPGRKPGENRLCPIKLNGEFMVKASHFALGKLRSGRWTSNQFKAYLLSCNINEARIAMIEKAALSDNPLETKFLSDAWIYNMFDHFRLPDLPLHNLAHGIIADVIAAIHSILSAKHKFDAFTRFGNKILSEVASFKLDFCKVKLLPKTAWVGENTMGYMRLLSYLYAMFLANDTMGSGEGTDTLVSSIRCLLNALQALVSVLMTRKALETEMIRNHAKVLMSAAHDLHKSLQKCGMVIKKTKGQKQDVVKSLTREDLDKILREFSNVVTMPRPGPDGEVSETTLRNKVEGIKVEHLKNKLEEKDPSVFQLLQSSSTKSAIQLALFSRILNRRDVMARENEEAVEEEGEETKTIFWCKGNWLSMVTNIPDQIAFIGPLHLWWEAKDEKQGVNPIKDVLVSFRRTDGYRKARLDLLHRLYVVDALERAFSCDTGPRREWFSGYYVYNSPQEVATKFKEALPISTFCIDGSNAVHVAVRGARTELRYLSITYDTSDCFRQDTGVHFCRFNLAMKENSQDIQINSGEKEVIRSSIVHYALMLPYIVENCSSLQLFTLVYSDWDVLQCGHADHNKGRPRVEEDVFRHVLKQNPLA